jgi:hypothetical protein
MYLVQHNTDGTFSVVRLAVGMTEVPAPLFTSLNHEKAHEHAEALNAGERYFHHGDIVGEDASGYQVYDRLQMDVTTDTGFKAVTEPTVWLADARTCAENANKNQWRSFQGRYLALVHPDHDYCVILDRQVLDYESQFGYKAYGMCPEVPASEVDERVAALNSGQRYVADLSDDDDKPWGVYDRLGADAWTRNYMLMVDVTYDREGAEATAGRYNDNKS